MTLEDLFTQLNAVFPYKVAYGSFPMGEVPAMPFIIINETSSDNFGADNQVYFKRRMVDIELYTQLKDPTTESTLEDTLDGLKIFYETTDTYLDDEKCHERIYSIEV